MGRPKEPLAGGGSNYKRRKQYLSQIVLLEGVGLRVLVLPIQLSSSSQDRAESGSGEANPEVSIGPVGIERVRGGWGRGSSW